DLRMHRTGVNGGTRFHFIRLLFHRVGSLFHFIRGFFHFISQSLLFWLSCRALLHRFVACRPAGVFLLFPALHLHSVVVHPLHTAVLHARHVVHVMLHASASFRRALGLTEFFLYLVRRLIARRHISWTFCFT